jgi:hypothetical protein
MEFLRNVLLTTSVIWLVCLMVTATYTYERREPPKFIALYTTIYFWFMMAVLFIRWLFF